MRTLKDTIDQKRRELDEIVIKLAVKAKGFDYHPKYPAKEACENAMQRLQEANHSLWLALLTLNGHE